MTGRELILKALNNEELPRVPWVPYTGVQIGQLTGYSAAELLQDGEKLFDSLVEAEKQYSPDGMPVIFDLQIEAEVLGCDLKWAEDSPPTVSTHPLAGETLVPEKLPGKDEGRIPMALDVMNRFRIAAPDTALYGLICGPFTLASHLRSTNIFMDMYDNPEYVSSLLEYCTDVFLTMADYYIETGMDIVAPVDPLVSQISPEAFEQFMYKPYKRLFDTLRERGVHSSFFVCGDATKNLDLMCRVGPDCLGIDENIDLEEAKKVTDRHNVVLSGNIQLTVVMLLGNQRDSMKAAIEKIDAMGRKNFILAPGCDMPYNTPVENIIGAAQAVQGPDAARKLVEGYVKEEMDIEVEMPDYENLDHTLVEVLTIDSSTCAACGYMKAAADDMISEFGDKVRIVERKITEPENIARLSRLGVSNLPSICVNGELKFSSVIPNRDELKECIGAGV